MNERNLNPSLWTSAKEELPVEFWTQAESVIEDPEIQIIYATLVARIRNELGPEASTIDLMLAERGASMYSSLRQLENKGAFQNSRYHKEYSKVVISILTQLRSTMMEQQAQDDVVAKMAEAVFEQAEKLPPEQGKALIAAVTNALGDFGQNDSE